MREVLALALLFLAIISVIGLFAPHAGAIVEPWHAFMAYLLGWGVAFAPPLLAGFAVMLWMKTMPAERWMAASGAALVALALLGMFHLGSGGGAEQIETGDGGGLLGFAVSSALVSAIGAAGAWIVLVLFVAVGLLLYFNMTIGDVVAAWLQGRDEARELAEIEARRIAQGSRGRPPKVAPAAEPEADERPGLIDRMRGALAGGNDAHEDEPLIVRRQRPEGGNGSGPRPPRVPIPVADAPVDADAAIELDSEERAHLAATEAGDTDAPPAIDAALEAVERPWELPAIDLLADAPHPRPRRWTSRPRDSASARRSPTSVSASRWRASRKARSSPSTRSTSTRA